MISKSAAKFIKSLQLKKYRKLEQAFLVEGAKSVLETMKYDFDVKMAIATGSFIEQHEKTLNANDIVEVSEKELQSLGTFKTNNTAMLVVKTKPNIPFEIGEEYILALDGVNDPGNMGAIVRIADWYGINKIVASNDTVDLYNPKVIAATKGSFNRVNIFYTNLNDFLSQHDLDIYGADMSGHSVHSHTFAKRGVVVMGNEANGISPEVQKLLSAKITIPRFGEAESLNVAMATAIVCDNLMQSIK